jgi:hypothetical protein
MSSHLGKHEIVQERGAVNRFRETPGMKNMFTEPLWHFAKLRILPGELDPIMWPSSVYDEREHRSSRASYDSLLDVLRFRTREFEARRLREVLWRMHKG